MANKISLGTLYVNGEKIISPTKPWSTSSTTSTSHPTGEVGNLQGNVNIESFEVKETDSDEAYVIKWVDVNENGTFLISDRVLYKCTCNYISNSKDLQDGKLIALNNRIYLLKSITENEYLNYIANDLQLPNLPTPSDLDNQTEWNSDKYYSETNEVWNWVGASSLFPFKSSDSKILRNIYNFTDDKDKLFANSGIRLTLTLISEYNKYDMPQKIDTNTNLIETVNTVNDLHLGLETYKNNLIYNLIAKGVECSLEDKMSSLIDKISEINVGKKWASGETVSSSNTVTFNCGSNTYKLPYITIPLDFEPSYIIAISDIYTGSVSSYLMRCCTPFIKDVGFSVPYDYCTTHQNASSNSSTYSVKIDDLVILGNNLYRIPIKRTSMGIKWIAFE